MKQNPQICQCPYTDWCHPTRQTLQIRFREESNRDRKVEQCIFYQKIQGLLKKREDIGDS